MTLPPHTDHKPHQPTSAFAVIALISSTLTLLIQILLFKTLTSEIASIVGMTYCSSLIIVSTVVLSTRRWGGPRFLMLEDDHDHRRIYAPRSVWVAGRGVWRSVSRRGSGGGGGVDPNDPEIPAVPAPPYTPRAYRENVARGYGGGPPPGYGR